MMFLSESGDFLYPINEIGDLNELFFSYTGRLVGVSWSTNELKNIMMTFRILDEH